MKKYTAVIAISLLILFVGLKWNYCSLFLPCQYRLAAHASFSEQYFLKIATFVASLGEQNYSGHIVIEQLKKQFPVLDTVAIFHTPLGAYVTVQPQKLLCLVNNSLVLTSGNELVSQDIFVDRMYQKLPCINVAQDTLEQMSPVIVQLLKNMPRIIDQKYIVQVMNEHYVRLIDKEQPQFSIVSSVEQEKLPLLAQCAVIKKNISERAGFDKDVQWIADTRFAHYIVVHKT